MVIDIIDDAASDIDATPCSLLRWRCYALRVVAIIILRQHIVSHKICYVSYAPVITLRAAALMMILLRERLRY